MPNPSVQVFPPVENVGGRASTSSDKAWFSRSKLKRAASAQPIGSDPAVQSSDRLSVRDAPHNRSSLSLASSAGDHGEYTPPKIVPSPSSKPTRHPPRHQRVSTTSSAFLSVSPAVAPSSDAQPSLPLTSLYLVSGLPKSPQTWTLADPDSVAGVHHSEGAVGRFWRAEVLGSSVTPGVGGKKRRGKGIDGAPRVGTLSKGDLGKMLSKSLKLSFTREVEIIASTLQPASSVHTFTFQLPTSSDTPSTTNNGILRTSMLSTATSADRLSAMTSPYMDPAFPRPSSTYLGPSAGTFPSVAAPERTAFVTYYGVCLTVWSHADEERSTAIRATLEQAARHRSGRRAFKLSSAASMSMDDTDTERPRKKSNPWSATGAEESEFEGAESDVDGLNVPSASAIPGGSTLFLPPNTVFWLPYALTLISRHPIYDLMRDYLTLSWARFSKDVQAHTLQISRILEFPAPRAGEILKIDAGVSGESMEVVCRFPGGMDFGRGLIDVNFTMWPLFRCLNLDNILTLCELALAPTGRVLFLSRHPAMLGIAVCTLKYLVELRGWNGVALPIVHARDAKIYLEDPGPWIIGMPTETRYTTRTMPEVCICDLDINYVNCSAPPPGVVSIKAQREKYRRILMSAFDQYFHPDNSVPSEFKEAFPAGRFRPLCKIQTKRGSSSTAVAEGIHAPDWWHQTRVIQAFDVVLKDKYKKPTFLKRLSMIGVTKPQTSLTPAELQIQMSIRKRASAFVDARDDLETKIGRLSRRLNFLMTESELWKQKFASFEEYAETLSAEAAELRAKIGKEQRESKRLSGLVTITSQEKAQLKSKLMQTEAAHKDAVVELERMKEDMEEMERERSQMIAEVEAQIEKALVSIAFTDEDGGSVHSGYSSSRPGSRMSSRPSSTHLSHDVQGLSTFDTSTTLTNDALADNHPDGDVSQVTIGPPTVMSTVKEMDEEPKEELSEKALRRFSAGRRESHLDGLNAVDHGISERTDAVALKMQQIQQKLDAARASTRTKRSGSTTSNEGSARVRGRGHRHKPSDINAPPVPRAQSSKRMSPPPTPRQVQKRPSVASVNTVSLPPTSKHGDATQTRTPISARTPTTASSAVPSLEPAGAASTDEDDWQSAISGQDEEDEDGRTLARVSIEDPEMGVEKHVAKEWGSRSPRDRALSEATTVGRNH